MIQLFAHPEKHLVTYVEKNMLLKIKYTLKCPMSSVFNQISGLSNERKDPRPTDESSKNLSESNILVIS